MGKQHIHAVTAVAIGQREHLAQVVRAVSGFYGNVHHLVLEDSAVLLCENPVASLIRVKFVGPRGLEEDSVEQIHCGVGVETVKDFGDHAIGVGVAPVVDDVHITVNGEVKCIDLGIVKLLHVLLILWDKAVAPTRVDVDAISDFYRHR